ncbi:MAG: hypothetical protein U5O39_15285 [Gammaproteobacteria bacterium]|nr:hypothetical protein [Gammaproteobacteria bacterium]
MVVTPVRVNLALTDRAVERINTAHKLILEDSDLRRFEQDLSLTDLSEIKSERYVEVDTNGNLLFSPVSKSGVYRATLRYEDAERDIEIFVEPEKREWIMVGLAEGSIAYNELSGNMESLEDAELENEFDADGRVAFYAKGQVKGEYALTMAYDTAEGRRGRLHQIIDPNQYYTLYGDRTLTQYDAASREKLFLKIEKDQFYALFGDFSTGLTVTELSRYSRSFTGLKTEFKGESFGVNAFVSEADQAFIRDELQGDGTSGLYHLSSDRIIPNSEQVAIETRDRFQSQDIVDSKQLQRHIDYTIDYDKGTLFFKRPDPAARIPLSTPSTSSSTTKSRATAGIA